MTITVVLAEDQLMVLGALSTLLASIRKLVGGPGGSDVAEP